MDYDLLSDLIKLIPTAFYVDDNLLKNNEGSDGNTYKIHDKEFCDIDDRYRDNDLVDFELFKEERDEVDESTSEEVAEIPTPVTITITKESDGVLVNSKTYLEDRKWNTVMLSGGVYQCAVCQEIVAHAVDSHISSASHKMNMERRQPLSEYELSVIRKVNQNYHCGVCNVVFESIAEHTKKITHEQNLKFAINTAFEIMIETELVANGPESRTDENSNIYIDRNKPLSLNWRDKGPRPNPTPTQTHPNMNSTYIQPNSPPIQLQSIYRMNSPVNNGNVFDGRGHLTQLSNVRPGILNPYNAYAGTFGPVRGTYNTALTRPPWPKEFRANAPIQYRFGLDNNFNPAEMYGSGPSGNINIAGTMPKYSANKSVGEPKMDTNEVVPRYVSKVFGGNVIKMTYNSWNMVLNTQNVSYCMACCENINKKSAHCSSQKHFENLNRCKVVQAYEGFVIRKVGNQFMHCSSCNKLQFSPDLARHIISQHAPVKQLALAPNEVPSELSRDAFHTTARNLPSQTLALGTDCATQGSQPIRTFAPNANVFNIEIKICPFDLDITISLLYYNTVFCKFGNLKCSICDCFVPNDVVSHICCTAHTNFLRLAPFITNFNNHLIREFRGILHCAICNVTIVHDSIFNHIVNPPHTILFNKATSTQIESLPLVTAPSPPAAYRSVAPIPVQRFTWWQPPVPRPQFSPLSPHPQPSPPLPQPPPGITRPVMRPFTGTMFYPFNQLNHGYQYYGVPRIPTPTIQVVPLKPRGTFDGVNITEIKEFVPKASIVEVTNVDSENTTTKPKNILSSKSVSDKELSNDRARNEECTEIVGNTEVSITKKPKDSYLTNKDTKLNQKASKTTSKPKKQSESTNDVNCTNNTEQEPSETSTIKPTKVVTATGKTYYIMQKQTESQTDLSINDEITESHGIFYFGNTSERGVKVPIRDARKATKQEESETQHSVKMTTKSQIPDEKYNQKVTAILKRKKHISNPSDNKNDTSNKVEKDQVIKDSTSEATGRKNSVVATKPQAINEMPPKGITTDININGEEMAINHENIKSSEMELNRKSMQAKSNQSDSTTIETSTSLITDSTPISDFTLEDYKNKTLKDIISVTKVPTVDIKPIKPLNVSKTSPKSTPPKIDGNQKLTPEITKEADPKIVKVGKIMKPTVSNTLEAFRDISQKIEKRKIIKDNNVKVASPNARTEKQINPQKSKNYESRIVKYPINPISQIVPTTDTKTCQIKDVTENVENASENNYQVKITRSLIKVIEQIKAHKSVNNPLGQPTHITITPEIFNQMSLEIAKRAIKKDSKVALDSSIDAKKQMSQDIRDTLFSSILTNENRKSMHPKEPPRHATYLDATKAIGYTKYSSKTEEKRIISIEGSNVKLCFMSVKQPDKERKQKNPLNDFESWPNFVRLPENKLNAKPKDKPKDENLPLSPYIALRVQFPEDIEDISVAERNAVPAERDEIIDSDNSTPRTKLFSEVAKTSRKSQETPNQVETMTTLPIDKSIVAWRESIPKVATPHKSETKLVITGFIPNNKGIINDLGKKEKMPINVFTKLNEDATSSKVDDIVSNNKGSANTGNEKISGDITKSEFKNANEFTLDENEKAESLDLFKEYNKVESKQVCAEEKNKITIEDMKQILELYGPSAEDTSTGTKNKESKTIEKKVTEHDKDNLEKSNKKVKEMIPTEESTTKSIEPKIGKKKIIPDEKKPSEQNRDKTKGPEIDKTITADKNNSDEIKEITEKKPTLDQNIASCSSYSKPVQPKPSTNVNMNAKVKIPVVDMDLLNFDRSVNFIFQKQTPKPKAKAQPIKTVTIEMKTGRKEAKKGKKPKTKGKQQMSTYNRNLINEMSKKCKELSSPVARGTEDKPVKEDAKKAATDASTSRKDKTQESDAKNTTKEVQKTTAITVEPKISDERENVPVQNPPNDLDEIVSSESKRNDLPMETIYSFVRTMCKPYNTEEMIYLKCRGSYFKVTLNAFHSLTSLNDGTKFCFVCWEGVTEVNYKKHVESENHGISLTEYKYLECYDQEILRWNYVTYHCSACNVIFSNLEKHINWIQHDTALLRTKKTSRLISKDLKNKKYMLVTADTTNEIPSERTPMDLTYIVQEFMAELVEN